MVSRRSRGQRMATCNAADMLQPTRRRLPWLGRFTHRQGKNDASRRAVPVGEHPPKWHSSGIVWKRFSECRSRKLSLTSIPSTKPARKRFPAPAGPFADGPMERSPDSITRASHSRTPFSPDVVGGGDLASPWRSSSRPLGVEAVPLRATPRVSLSAGLANVILSRAARPWANDSANRASTRRKRCAAQLESGERSGRAITQKSIGPSLRVTPSRPARLSLYERCHSVTLDARRRCTAPRVHSVAHVPAVSARRDAHPASRTSMHAVRTPGRNESALPRVVAYL